MYAGDPVLDPVNVQAALGEFDLLPLQVADLGGPQTVPIGDQDHGRVAMPVAAMLSGALHQPLNLALGEVSPLDCQVYDAWGAFLGCRFHADKLCPRGRRDGCAACGGGTSREANLILSCRRTFIIGPPRGDFSVSNFHPGAIPGNLV